MTDSDPTPRHGRAAPLTLDGRHDEGALGQRFEPRPAPRHTAPAGIPTEEPRRRRTVPDSAEIEPESDPIEARVEAVLRRKIRRLWKAVATVAGVAITALIAAGRGYVDEARKAGAAEVRLETLRRDLDEARAALGQLTRYVYSSAARWRRDDQPDMPAAASAAPKGTPP